MNRRQFVALAGAAAAPGQRPRAASEPVNTVRGPVRPGRLGTTLIHEHILVDFIGANEASPARYNADDVFRTALPKLQELAERGCKTLVECTPAYLGRDPALLRRLSEATGLHIVTNTGFYGANADKHVPAFAHSETPEQLASRWTAEFRKGIDATGIRPAFMKIGVDAGPLAGVDRKLIEAACICHGQTRMRMHVHCGNGAAARDILEVLQQRRVPPAAFVWVHAQNERDRAVHLEAAGLGAWLEFDGVNQPSHQNHAAAVLELAGAGLLDQLLISQDSGWYRVGEPRGGAYNGYTYLFDSFLPDLRKRGLSDVQIRKLIVDNPARVLSRQTR